MNPTWEYCNEPTACRHAGIALWHARRFFRPRVEFVDLSAVAVLDDAAAEFQRRREGSVVDAELVSHQHDALEFFEARHVPVYAFHDSLVEALHLGVRHQILARREGDVICLRPRFQRGEIRRDDYASKLPFVAENRRNADQVVALQRIFDGLRGDELSPRSLD